MPFRPRPICLNAKYLKWKISSLVSIMAPPQSLSPRLSRSLSQLVLQVNTRTWWSAASTSIHMRALLALLCPLHWALPFLSAFLYPGLNLISVNVNQVLQLESWNILCSFPVHFLLPQFIRSCSGENISTEFRDKKIFYRWNIWAGSRFFWKTDVLQITKRDMSSVLRMRYSM